MVSISLILAFIWDQRKQQDYYYYIPSFELLRRHTVYRISLNTHLFEYSYMARENKHYVAKFLILIIVSTTRTKISQNQTDKDLFVITFSNRLFGPMIRTSFIHQDSSKYELFVLIMHSILVDMLTEDFAAECKGEERNYWWEEGGDWKQHFIRFVASSSLLLANHKHQPRRESLHQETYFYIRWPWKNKQNLSHDILVS